MVSAFVAYDLDDPFGRLMVAARSAAVAVTKLPAAFAAAEQARIARAHAGV